MKYLYTTTQQFEVDLNFFNVSYDQQGYIY